VWIINTHYNSHHWCSGVCELVYVVLAVQVTQTSVCKRLPENAVYLQKCDKKHKDYQQKHPELNVAVKQTTDSKTHDTL